MQAMLSDGNSPKLVWGHLGFLSCENGVQNFWDGNSASLFLLFPGPSVSYCGWAKSISHHLETMLEAITFVDIYVGESVIMPGILNGAFYGLRNHPHRTHFPHYGSKILLGSSFGRIPISPKAARYCWGPLEGGWGWVESWENFPRSPQPRSWPRPS